VSAVVVRKHQHRLSLVVDKYTTAKPLPTLENGFVRCLVITAYQNDHLGMLDSSSKSMSTPGSLSYILFSTFILIANSLSRRGRLC
jgi:hypothetical protein